MQTRRPWQLITATLTTVALLAGGCKPQPESAADTASVENRPAPPRWAVSPLKVGSDRPPVGRSLFDFVMSRSQDGRRVYDLPFPFPALLQRLRERAGCVGQLDCLKVVMIPLGRSLQRLAATPEFFHYPRVVVAVTGQGSTVAAPLLKDRLYLGYQEKTGILEVISYNEAAGRFEFQLVNDYRAGGTPQVRYARRSVCTACHQNVAPIFSRQPWLETNANPAIATRLAADGERRYGVAVDASLSTPNAIDDATDRANLLAVWQRLWRDGCGDDDAGRRCRAAAVLAALQYRLSGGRGFDRAATSWREDFLPVFTRQWQARWPGGLAIPNPDLPNRDPLPDTPGAPSSGAALAHVPARFEPLQPRAPLQVWTLAEPDDAVARRFVAGLGGFFTDADTHLIDHRLAALATASPQQSTHTLPCQLHWSASELRFDCRRAGAAAATPSQLSGALPLADAASGRVDTFALAGAPLHYLSTSDVRLERGHAQFVPLADDLRARLPTGDAIARIELHWSPASTRRVDGQRRNDDARVVIHTVDDLAPLRAAIDALAARDDEASPLRAATFSRTGMLGALLPRLGIAEQPRCCLDASAFAAVRVEPGPPPKPSTGSTQRFADFFVQCAACHATAEASPPNFLHGPPQRVLANLRHCAPRIYTRLSMWQRAPQQREKTPMPPPIASAHRQQFQPPKQLDDLLTIASDLLREQTGREPSVDALLEDGYETMRPCLPPRAPPQTLARRDG